ncbi:hypothetical protein ACVGWP_17565, partial [Enterobacter hormaechei]
PPPPPPPPPAPPPPSDISIRSRQTRSQSRSRGLGDVYKCQRLVLPRTSDKVQLSLKNQRFQRFYVLSCTRLSVEIRMSLGA